MKTEPWLTLKRVAYSDALARPRRFDPRIANLLPRAKSAQIGTTIGNCGIN
jgi:hypothetical protein